MLRGWIFATLLLGFARGVAEVTVGKMRSEQPHGWLFSPKHLKKTRKNVDVHHLQRSFL
jgi:hypothetical protein